ncbi:MAG: heavy metal-associated domain-containing protein [bacterium]
MKKIGMLISIICLFNMSIILGQAPIDKAENKHKNKQTVKEGDDKTVTSYVEGMVCDFCARGLEKVFAQHAAVASINVSLEEGTVSIKMKPNKTVSNEKITELIKNNGLSVRQIVRSKEKEEKKEKDKEKQSKDDKAEN